MKKYIIILTFLFIPIVIFFNKDIFHGLLEDTDNPKIILEDLTNDKMGIYAFGFEECPWCEQLYPILDEAVRMYGEEVRYVDTHSEKFTEKERTSLKKYLMKNTEFDDIVVPYVVMVGKNGSYQYHVGTLEGHDASKDKLTVSQESELQKRLEDMIYTYKERNK
ncbi:transporter [Vagococcus fluvialis]|uniref:transporter n=1 Tax=Vagococcus fluvialis TaxID=2738 RepID=UPI001A8F2AB5|nr:transporter [Vagococcus fluvialis]MBO0487682.1 transporter [Vagococcus fluvialis]